MKFFQIQINVICNMAEKERKKKTLRDLIREYSRYPIPLY